MPALRIAPTSVGSYGIFAQIAKLHILSDEESLLRNNRLPDLRVASPV
ncbi:MAG: hypothetical protein N2651_10390 [Fimbriimonadales bacterium]|nr:hypothetical protein [Fimbriimonadales bacterium]